MTVRQRLIYLANARIPTEKAHGYQMFKMCEAFTHQGLEVEFWHPERENTAAMRDVEDVFSYYGVKRSFRLKPVSCRDWSKLKVISKRLWHSVLIASFAREALRNLRQIHDKGSLVYTRHLLSALLLSRGKRKGGFKGAVIFEAHAFPEGVRRIIYTTNAIEALNSKPRRAVRTRGHFPSDEAAAKLLYFVLNHAAAEWKRPPREWSEAKTQFAVMFKERFVRT